MTESQKLEIRGSEIRGRLNEISRLEGDALTDAVRAESDRLGQEYRDVEVRRRAAIVAEDVEKQAASPTIDTELRERIELRGKVTMGAYLMAASRGALVSGAEAELLAAAGIKGSEPQIPLDVWEPRTVDALEARAKGDGLEARAVTPAPASGTGTNVTPIQPAIFDPSIARQCRIDMPSAQSGSYSEMVIATPPTAAAREKSAAFTATAGALTAVTAGPRRISAALEVTMEDVASVGTPSFESSLRMATSQALSDQLDEQIINGGGTAPALSGLLHQLTRPTNPTDVADFDDYNAAVADRVDGIWAGSMRDVRMLVAAKGYALAAKSFRDISTADLGDVSAASYLMDKAGGFSAAARLLTPASGSNENIADGLAVLLGKPGLRVACLPTWASVVIDDIYTQADKATRVYNMHVLVGEKVILNYSAAFSFVTFKVA